MSSEADVDVLHTQTCDCLESVPPIHGSFFHSTQKVSKYHAFVERINNVSNEQKKNAEKTET